MMVKLQRCMVLLVNAVAGFSLVSGTVGTVKYVCPEDSVQLFNKIEYDRCNALVSLSVNGDRYTKIASWSYKNCTLNATFIEGGYNGKVVLHENGSITIHNLHHFDQGKYVVVANNGTSPSIQEVQIVVMVAPGKDCRPKIERFGNMLHVASKSVGCGEPVTTSYWKVNDSVSNPKEPVLTIAPANETRVYMACIEGPALQCVHSLTPQDYCSLFVIEGSTSGTVPSLQHYTTVIFVVIIVVVIILIVLITLLFLKCLCVQLKAKYSLCNGKSRSSGNDHHADSETHIELNEANAYSCKDKSNEQVNLMKSFEPKEVDCPSCKETLSSSKGSHQCDVHKYVEPKEVDRPSCNKPLNSSNGPHQWDVHEYVDGSYHCRMVKSILQEEALEE